MARGDLAISLYNVAGTLKGVLDAEAQDLVFRTTAPGGCLSATWTLARSVLLTYDDLDFPFDVRITDTLGIVWRGRLDKWDGDLQEQSESIEVTALNTQASDDEYTSKTFGAGTPIETCFSAIRTDLMPLITTESLVTTGRSLTAALTLTDKRAGACMNLLRMYGTSGDVELEWYLWPDGASDAWQLLLEAKASTPGYYVGIQDYVGKIGFDGQNYTNRQRVRYNGGANTVTVDDAAEQTARGFIRAGKLITVSEITNVSDATFVATVALNGRKQLRMTGEQATISAPFAVTDSNRQAVDLWRVRAGKILAIEGPQPAVSGSYTFDRNQCYIVATAYHAATGVLELTFESFETMLEGVLASLLSALTG